MSKRLFNEALAFKFDENFSEYGFATRLAKENGWTQNFTERAIVEYKKFMYLAATASAMVSPSEIVDIVWHQHLIFTKSYKDFCTILGKKIEHIPSTHNRAEFEKFSQAKERTQKLYESHFGKQPSDIWDSHNMLDTLGLKVNSFTMNFSITMSLFVMFFLSIPMFFLFKPVFIQIDNPMFMIGYGSLVIFTFVVLELYNRNYFMNVINKMNKNAFIFDLTPLELVYLKKEDISHSIHGVVNQLIKKNKFSVGADYRLNKRGKISADSLEEFQVIDTADTLGTTNYPTLLKHLVRKPVFANISSVMDSFKSYFKKTEVFKSAFNTNLIILIILFLIGATRFAVGISRGKPVVFISLLLVIVLIAAIVYLNRLTGFFSKFSLPKWYKHEIAESKKHKRNIHDWQDIFWDYFLLDSAVFTASFIPLATYTEKNGYLAASSTCGSSCGSSFGGGCGGGCGGCGG